MKKEKLTQAEYEKNYESLLLEECKKIGLKQPMLTAINEKYFIVSLSDEMVYFKVSEMQYPYGRAIQKEKKVKAFIKNFIPTIKQDFEREYALVSKYENS